MEIKLSELFKKIKNNEKVPEWIIIKCKVPKKVQIACGQTFDPNRGYSNDNEKYYWNDIYKNYFKATGRIAFLSDIKEIYTKEVFDTFTAIDYIPFEEEKHEKLESDKTWSGLASLGIYINKK